MAGMATTPPRTPRARPPRAPQDRQPAAVKAAHKPPRSAGVSIEVKKRDAIPLIFGDDEYTILPPKGAMSLDLAERAQDAVANGDVKSMWGEIEGWFIDGLGEEQWDRIDARLHDPTDDLDIVHLIQAMEALVEVVTDSPTSSSSD